MKRQALKAILSFLLMFSTVITLISQEINIQQVFEFTESEEDENYIFWKPESFDVDEEGNIYILDSGNGRIQKFDSKGRYVMTIGRKGKGPGEFNWPEAMRISNNIIFVYGPINIRITRFTLDGELIGSVNSRKLFFGFRDFDHKGNIYNRDTKNPGPASANILTKYDAEGNFKFELGKKEPWPAGAISKIDMGSGGFAIGNQALFGSNILCTVDKENNVYVTYPYSTPQIVKYSSSGDKLLEINQKIERVVIKDEDTKYLTDKYKEMDSINIPKYKPFIKYITTDDKDNIWIATYKGENIEEIHFLVLSEEGQFLNNAVIKAENSRAVRKIRIRKDNVYIFFYSDEEGARLIKYKILGDN